jgi:small subunit ribosomal protein S17
MAKTTPKPNTEVKAKAKKHVFMGVVVSDKMTDTAVVLIHNYVKHPKYQKFMQKSKKYKAHNPGNTKKIGDSATIEECRPISKDKHFIVIK